MLHRPRQPDARIQDRNDYALQGKRHVYALSPVRLGRVAPADPHEPDGRAQASLYSWRSLRSRAGALTRQPYPSAYPGSPSIITRH